MKTIDGHFVLQKKGYLPCFFIAASLTYLLIYESDYPYPNDGKEEPLFTGTADIQHKVLSKLHASEESNSTTPVYLIWTKWRSGSSYFGGIFSHAIKGTFYGYEPLHAFGIKILRDNDIKTKYAIKFLHDISNCKHEKHPELLKYLKTARFYFKLNPAFTNLCGSPDCYTIENLHKACKQAPLRVFKIIRLGLFAGKYLLQANPNLKIVYLVRDPRPTLRSRRQFLWCLVSDCHSPSTVCDILENDVMHAKQLKKDFPDRFFYLRYEDVALNPTEEFQKMWESLGQTYTRLANKTVQRHSYNNPKSKIQKDRYGTIKDSREIVFKWRDSLDYESMKKIQDKCENILETLGYTIFSNEQEFNDQSISALVDKRLPIFEPFKDA